MDAPHRWQARWNVNAEATREKAQVPTATIWLFQAKFTATQWRCRIALRFLAKAVSRYG
jgi:hypothetical protein